MRVEIIASMGLGKTALCQQFEKAGDFHCIYEDVSNNPYIEKRLSDPAYYAFPAQMWFMMNKYTAIKEQSDPNKINVLDYSMLSEMAFINVQKGACPQLKNLSQQSLAYMRQQSGDPDLILYLESSVSSQSQRIVSRNRSFEQAIALDLGYLATLKSEFEAAMRIAQDRKIPVLRVDAGKNDFRSSPKLIADLQAEIRAYRPA